MSKTSTRAAKETGQTVSMSKFIVYSRKGKTTVYEVDCAKILPMEDPCVTCLPQGEYMARIFKPEILFEPSSKDNTKMVPPVWYSHAFFDTCHEAIARAQQDVRHGMVDYQLQKKQEAKSEEEIRAAEEAIEVVML